MSVDAELCGRLGAFLTGSEATDLADRLAAQQTLSSALVTVGTARRSQVRALLQRSGLSGSPDTAIGVLRAIAGSHERRTTITPVWTTPGHSAKAGALTASVRHFVTAARSSVVCSTYNFQRSSVLWSALAEVAGRAEVAVRVYVDTNAASGKYTPTPTQIAHELSGAVVLRTKPLDGQHVRNHAKFIAVDHQYLIVTSANFSKSAEMYNVELGLQIENPIITQAVESQMRALEPIVYERVSL